jgi:hypothetical protein
MYLLDMRDNAGISEKHLTRVAKEGIAAVRSGLRELETAGYLIRTDKPADAAAGRPQEWYVFERSKALPDPEDIARTRRKYEAWRAAKDGAETAC